MNLETLRTLTDKELQQAVAICEEELQTRKDKREQDTIAKIKEMAKEAGVVVTIGGKRGKPGRKPDAKALRAAKA